MKFFSISFKNLFKFSMSSAVFKLSSEIISPNEWIFYLAISSVIFYKNKFKLFEYI